MTTSDIDLNFRPSSYFWPLRLASHLLATVKGAERRAMLQRLIDSDRLDFLTEFLAKSDLSKEERTSVAVSTRYSSAASTSQASGKAKLR